MDKRIREDLPEARPIIERIDLLVAESERRHAEMQEGEVKYLTHRFDLLTEQEKTELHSLKMMLRCKTPEEAKADLLAKRLARKSNTTLWKARHFLWKGTANPGLSEAARKEALETSARCDAEAIRLKSQHPWL